MFNAVADTMDSIMKPVFGTPTGRGVLPTGGIATQTPMEKMLGNFGLRCVLSARMKPRGLVRPSMPRTADTPRNAGQQHRVGERKFVTALRRRVVVDLFDRHFAGLDLRYARIRDPFDMPLAQLAFEHRFRVADAVEAEMPDIRFGRHEGHRHAVA